MSELILHHYPQSPVSEKVRKAMGLKSLAWRSVEQNRLPDRPELFAMTGGYRRLPVLQSGADLYCDTQCIFRELERRVPSPTFFPNGEIGLSFAISRWTDGAMFDLAMRVVFAPLADSLPPDLVADRARLYLGPAGNFTSVVADSAHTLAQLRPQLGWLEDQLSSGFPFMLGDKAGLADVLAWFVVWFLRGKNASADRLLEEFPRLAEWAHCVEAIGYGVPMPMTPKEALEAAKIAEPKSGVKIDRFDPQGLKAGVKVSIAPLSDGGETPIEGHVAGIDRNIITIEREDPECGRVFVHFPRAGYRVSTP